MDIKNFSLTDFEDWLNSFLNFEKTPKKNIFWLDTMKFLASKFGNPQNSYPTIHVAGSKGKGSVSSFMAPSMAPSSGQFALTVVSGASQ